MIANHLIQSTVFAAVAGLLTLFLRNNRAGTRYWIWLTASLKFLVPFSLFVEIGHRLTWTAAPVLTQPQVSFVMNEVLAPIYVAPSAPAKPTASAFPILPVLWIAGTIAVLVFWLVRWLRVARALRKANPTMEGRAFDRLRRLDARTKLASFGNSIEPGIFGILRPVLYLPEGITDHLDDAQLDAILAHELTHIRRRDNLTAALHMLVEAIFWFHPLVWWIGTKLVEERERACDEEVVRLGSDPEVYAESILKICRHYLESPLVCVSGVTGADLRKRIVEIVINRPTCRLSTSIRILLTVSGLSVILLPVVAGILNVSLVRAQSAPLPSGVRFDVASIKPSDPKSPTDIPRFFPGGRFTAINATIHNVIRRVFEVDNFQLVGEPQWLDSERYSIEAKAAGSTTDDQVALMVQALLVDRFGLKFHRETRQMPVYALTVAVSGTKLNPSPDLDACGNRGCFSMGFGEFSAKGATLARTARALGAITGRPVIDRTELAGSYDFRLHFDPSSVSGPLAPAGIKSDEPSIFTALQEQAGLKLEPRKGEVEVLVIDSIERPSPN